MSEQQSDLVSEEDETESLTTSNNGSAAAVPIEICGCGDGNDNKNGDGDASKRHSILGRAWRSLFYFTGLQASYLTWGVMQELLMTSTFVPTPSCPDGKFPSAAFCVLSNRILSILVAAVAVRVRHGAVLANNAAPLLWFAPCALSNTASSWCQYAALRYVSFPVQTVFKSSKIVPVMIMGTLLLGRTYPRGQYVEALLITAGVIVFSVVSAATARSEEAEGGASTQFIGLLLMTAYVCSDCFTSHWQDKVYVKYGTENVDPLQMMLGLNIWAILMTAVGLTVRDDVPRVVEFFRANPGVMWYNLVSSITSASGQFFIYATIREFGVVVFMIVMTTRQMISIVISSVAFGHAVPGAAAGGAAVVFGVLLYQIYRMHVSQKEQGQERQRGG